MAMAVPSPSASTHLAALVEASAALAAIPPAAGPAAVFAALYERERSGEGQVVETSLLEAAGALAAHRLIRDTSGEPHFNRFVAAFYRVYVTADGSIAIACYAPRLHARLLHALGLSGLLEDPRFSTLEGRARHSDELAAIVAERMASASSETWRATFAEAGLPHGTVADRPFSLLDHPEARAMGLVVEIEDPTLGSETVIGPPLRLSRTPARTAIPAPRLGEHTDAVLAEILAGVT